MSKKPGVTHELGPGGTVRIRLPHGIGYVDIRADGDDGRGHPQIEVEAVCTSDTPNDPAGDGRHYSASLGQLYTRIYLTGYRPEELY